MNATTFVANSTGAPILSLDDGAGERMVAAVKECALVKGVVTRAIVAAAIVVLLAVPAGAQTESASAEAAAPSSVAAASAGRRARCGRARVGGPVRARRRRRLRALLSRRRTRCGSASAAPRRLPSIRPTTTCRSGRRKNTARGPAAIPTDRRRCNFPWRLRSGRWAPRPAAGASPIPGRDLLRAQISVVSWTYAIKVAAQRTRPNGDPRSFPSGHASTSFATAMVLQEHFGWKAGLPAFALAAYTAASRVVANQHWASDVVFGAVVGMASGRTVTIHLRDTRLVAGAARGARRRRCARHRVEVAMKWSVASVQLIGVACAGAASAQDQEPVAPAAAAIRAGAGDPDSRAAAIADAERAKAEHMTPAAPGKAEAYVTRISDIVSERRDALARVLAERLLRRRLHARRRLLRATSARTTCSMSAAASRSPATSGSRRSSSRRSCSGAAAPCRCSAAGARRRRSTSTGSVRPRSRRTW